MRALRNTRTRNVNVSSKAAKAAKEIPDYSTIRRHIACAPCVQPIMQKSNKLNDCGNDSADVHLQQQISKR